MYRPSVSVGPCREQDSSPAGKPVSSIESRTASRNRFAEIAVHPVRAISLMNLDVERRQRRTGDAVV